MKYLHFLYFFMLITIVACKKTTKPISGIDYYIVNTFDDSIKLNFQYRTYFNDSLVLDSTRTVLRLKAKERKFISSATPLPYGRFQPNNELYQFYGNYYNSKIYGLRSNGDTIRPKYNSALKYSNYGSNWQSLAAAVYWKKEINEDTGAAIYTLELH